MLGGNFTKVIERKTQEKLVIKYIKKEIPDTSKTSLFCTSEFG